MPGRFVYYPSNFPAPGAFTTTAPPQPKGGFDVVAPSSTRVLPRAQYDAQVVAPGAFGTTNTTLGGAYALAPTGAKGRTSFQPDPQVWPPGAFTTTNTTFGESPALYPDATRGRKAFYPDSLVHPGGDFFIRPAGFDPTAPDRTRARVAFHPDSQVWPAGQFTTPNTTFGGVAFFPDRTRGPVAFQPDGSVLPPGAFTTVIQGVVKGWEAFFQATTRRLVGQQPDPQTWPAGKFTTPNTTQGWAAYVPERVLQALARTAAGATDVFPPRAPVWFDPVLPPAGPPARRPVPAPGDVFAPAVRTVWFETASLAVRANRPRTQSGSTEVFARTAPPAPFLWVDVSNTSRVRVPPRLQPIELNAHLFPPPPAAFVPIYLRYSYPGDPALAWSMTPVGLTWDNLGNPEFIWSLTPVDLDWDTDDPDLTYTPNG